MESFALISPKSLSAIPGRSLHLHRRRLQPHRAFSCRLASAPASERQSPRTSKSVDAVLEEVEPRGFASLSSAPPVAVVCPRSHSGSPFLWIGVGIGLSVMFSVVAMKLKRQAILRAFRAVMGEDAPQNGEFNTAAFAPGSPFPFPDSSPSATVTLSQTPIVPQPSVKADDPVIQTKAVLADVKFETEEFKQAASNETNISDPDQPEAVLASDINFETEVFKKATTNGSEHQNFYSSYLSPETNNSGLEQSEAAASLNYEIREFKKATSNEINISDSEQAEASLGSDVNLETEVFMKATMNGTEYGKFNSSYLSQETNISGLEQTLISSRPTVAADTPMSESEATQSAVESISPVNVEDLLG